MTELMRPFLRAWEWVGQTAGFPGQVFAVAAVVLAIVGGLTWYGNRR